MPLYDSGKAHGVLFFFMSYVEGESLSDRRRREGPLPFDDAIRIARDVAEALGYAHAHHVVHPDIKPENIWLTGGRALVMDLGIARAISAARGAALTETGWSSARPTTALDVRISRDEEQRIGKEPTSDFEAYHLCLKGRHCMLRYTAEGIRQSLEYFEEAIGKDPDFALAHAGLAWTCVILGMGFGAGEIRPAEAYRRGRRAVTMALDLDDDLGDAHGALAFLTFVTDCDWTGAERELRIGAAIPERRPATA